MVATISGQYGENLAGKGANLRCPACGKDGGWVGGTAMAYVLILEESGERPALEDARGGGGGMEAVPVVCSNCGFIRLHDPSYLD